MFSSAPTLMLCQVSITTWNSFGGQFKFKFLLPPSPTGALTTSQFPVFTLYVQKNCLRITVGPTEPVESITDGRGALRISPPSQRNPALRPQRVPTSRAEPVGANTVCNRAWSFERVQGYELETLAKRRRRVANRQACEELCLGEREFTCRWVWFSSLSISSTWKSIEHETKSLQTLKKREKTAY